MTRQQALEKAAKERSLAKEPAVAHGASLAGPRERADGPLLPGPADPCVSATLEDTHHALSRFADAFAVLLDTLREASAYGPNPDLSAKYEALREELGSDYGLLRKDLSPLIEPSGTPGALGFDFHGLWSDPFVRLLRPESLDEALRASCSQTASDAVRAGQALDRFWQRFKTSTPAGAACE